MRVWQIAAGTRQRDYSSLFLEHDVMFMGPGRHGAYEAGTYDRLAQDGKITAGQLHAVKQFATTIQPGDGVLLRRGGKVHAIGLATSDPYMYSPAFDDVYGWDLEHLRRVSWQRQLSGQLTAPLPVRLPTFTRVRCERVLGTVGHLWGKCKEHRLRPLPEAPPRPLGLEELGQELFSRGLPYDSIDRVLRVVERQRQLSLWYRTHGAESGRPTEHEVVAHMILPLLLALGWSEQLLAIEWHRADLAGFSSTPTNRDSCVLVCEAKGQGHGLQNVVEQPKEYLEKLKLTGCRKVLITNGTRLYLYDVDGPRWDHSSPGYVNINKIRSNCLLSAGAGAVDTIMALTPAGVGRPFAAFHQSPS